MPQSVPFNNASLLAERLAHPAPAHHAGEIFWLARVMLIGLSKQEGMEGLHQHGADNERG
jgi:hypothetical protein